MATLQQYIEAQKTAKVGPDGMYTYILNPDTGQMEKAFGGFVYAGGGGEDNQPGSLVLPESVAMRFKGAADPWSVIPGVGVEGNPATSIAPVQQSRGSDWGADYGFMVPFGAAALTAALAPALAGAGGAGGAAGAGGAGAGGAANNSLMKLAQAGLSDTGYGAGKVAAQGSGLFYTGGGAEIPLSQIQQVLGGMGNESFNAWNALKLPAAAGAGGLSTALQGAGAAASVAGAAGGSGGADSENSMDKGGFGATTPGYNLPTGTVTAPPPDSDFLNTILNGGAAGTGLAASLAQMTGLPQGLFDAAGKAIPGLIGAAGASQQSSALSDLANKYSEYGAPSRARYEASMAPGFDPTSIPGYSGAVDNASESILRRLSATGGNPYGSPGGLIEANKAVISGTALPAIQQYQNQNANTGGIGQLAGAYPGALNAATTAGTGVLGGVAGAAADVFNPKPQPISLADLWKQMQGGYPSAA